MENKTEQPNPETENHTTSTSPPIAAAATASATNSPPPRSSHHHEPPDNQPQPIPHALRSPPLSPLHLESRAVSPPPGSKSPDASSISSGHSSGSSHVSSLSDENLHHEPPESHPSPTPPVPVTVAVAKRLVQDEPKVVTEVDPGAQDRFASAGEIGDRDGGRIDNNRRTQRLELSILKKVRRKNLVKRFTVGFRVLGFVLCLVSFSVMAADKNQGWALDSFHRYKEFRYSMAVNVIGCAYSGVQAADVAYQLATGKRLIGTNHLRYHLDFFLDQVLAYLLMSSSSSAATRVEDWESNWGSDKFPSMASASVGLSFTAFFALALCSLVSGYVLCTLLRSSA